MAIDRPPLSGSFKLEKEGREFERQIFWPVDTNNPHYRRALSDSIDKGRQIEESVKEAQGRYNPDEIAGRKTKMLIEDVLLAAPEAQTMDTSHPRDRQNPALYAITRKIMEKMRALLQEQRLIDPQQDEDDFERVKCFSAVGTVLDSRGIDGVIAFVGKNNKTSYATIDAKTVDPLLREKHEATDVYLEKSKIYKTIYVDKDEFGKPIKDKNGKYRIIPEERFEYAPRREKEAAALLEIDDEAVNRYAEKILEILLSRNPQEIPIS